MTNRHIIALASLAGLLLMSCSSEDLGSRLAGRWQYLQPPDEEGEILELDVSSGHWRGIMNGLERAGEHGLFYYVVEIENFTVAPDGGISFEVGERVFFTKRPGISHLGGDGDGGFSRDRMSFSGRVKGGVLILRCEDENGSCPDEILRFKRLTAHLEPNQRIERTSRLPRSAPHAQRSV
jgi:hypothetical protein